MNKEDFEKLAKMRLREANRLLKAKQFPGAYYLAGLAIECALKACIAKMTQKHDFPDKNHAKDCYEHDPKKLIRTAQLETSLDLERKSNSQFDANWALVAQWKVESRYSPLLSNRDANDLYSAIVSRKHGVLKWLRQYW